MKKFHRNLLDGMMGPKDERERLEAYERLALGAAYIFWIALLLNLIGMLADWAPAKWAGGVLLLIFFLVHGWPKGKARDLSDDTIPNPREITPETARGILKQALPCRLPCFSETKHRKPLTARLPFSVRWCLW